MASQVTSAVQELAASRHKAELCVPPHLVLRVTYALRARVLPTFGFQTSIPVRSVTSTHPGFIILCRNFSKPQDKTKT